MCSAESDRYAGTVSFFLTNKAQTFFSLVSRDEVPAHTNTLPQLDLWRHIPHIISDFLIILLKCNIRSNLSSHLHSFIHSSHFFFKGYAIVLPSLPLLLLPSSFFLLFSSKFSCVIPSPRTPLISPLPVCLRNTDKRKRTEERGMAGQRQREGERNRKQEEKREKGHKKIRGWGE